MSQIPIIGNFIGFKPGSIIVGASKIAGPISYILTPQMIDDGTLTGAGINFYGPPREPDSFWVK